jgi:2-polyprenyl-3-methyl-5-hydroxy-6-metoxy-1,4-benzoquinol methylase
VNTCSHSILALANQLYGDVVGGTLQRLRPLICPFEALLDAVPEDSSVLDVGCGSGLFLGLLAASGKLRTGVGFDSSRAAIGRANDMRERLARPDALEFQLRDAAVGWPDGVFDIVSMIDVMHHVPAKYQRSLIQSAASRIRPGGVLLYKDMVRRPLWRAWMNRLHDLVLARQWIHYASIEDVQDWMVEAGFMRARMQKFAMYWYGHEMVVATRM